jgi:hypothetical protein
MVKTAGFRTVSNVLEEHAAFIFVASVKIKATDVSEESAASSFSQKMSTAVSPNRL